MGAFLLTLGLFLFWGLVGFSLVSLFGSRRNSARNVLLAPALGTAVTVLVISWLNRGGLAVKHAGPVVAVVLGVVSILCIRWRRPLFPCRRLRPFFLSLTGAALLNGYPMLLFGYNWVSYCNDDMANFSLISKLYLNQGYFELPDQKALLENRDASLFYWFFEPYSGLRSGSDELLAWVVSCTGLSSHQAFMPTILALYLTLVCAAAALIYSARKYWFASVLTCAWMAISALTALGVMYQLIAQIFGLELLVVLCTLLLQPLSGIRRPFLTRLSILAGIPGAAISIVYPEVIPFFILAFGAYHGILLVQRRESFRLFLGFSLAALLAIVVFAGPALISTISTALVQAASGVQSGENLNFPYYLIPSGPAYLWGFFAIGRFEGPELNLFIVLGTILLLACLAGSVRQAWRAEPVAVIFLVMAAMGGYLFYQRAGFGLFKLAMYMQPFLIGSFVLVWLQRTRNKTAGLLDTTPRRIAVLGPLLAVGGLGLISQVYYVQRSANGIGRGFVEIPEASRSHLVDTLLGLAREDVGPVIVSDTSNIVLAKFEALYFSPARLFFPSWEYFRAFLDPHPSVLVRWFLNLAHPHLENRAEALLEQHRATLKQVDFDMHGAIQGANRFLVSPEETASEIQGYVLAQSGPAQEVVNRRQVALEGSAPVRMVPSEKVHNHLIFVVSDLGQSSYAPPVERRAGRVSMYMPEKDLFYPERTMVALGRDSIFRILRPAAQVRMVIDFTATLNADHDNRIPAASVIGDERVFFPVEGRGSARLFSPPIPAQVVEGGSYLALDMGTGGIRFPDRRSGLMKLYGTDLVFDARQISGFVRDIAAVSSEEYAALRPPSFIQRFPDDLANKDLEYSGIYEDGWVAESSFLTLEQPEGRSHLVVRLMVPSIHGAATALSVKVLVDRQEVGRKELRTEETELSLPLEGEASKRKIELIFDRADHLPAPDNRPVSARVEFIGFQGP